ncbi:MAG: hypothetical protein VB031_05940 [Eubacteriaceae bacterium]|nr:hypothetical protein [Eubacteriaceae bacterium]
MTIENIIEFIKYKEGERPKLLVWIVFAIALLAFMNSIGYLIKIHMLAINIAAAIAIIIYSISTIIVYKKNERSEFLLSIASQRTSTILLIGILSCWFVLALVASGEKINLKYLWYVLIIYIAAGLISGFSIRRRIEQGQYNGQTWRDKLMGIGPSIAGFGGIIVYKVIFPVWSHRTQLYVMEVMIFCVFAITIPMIVEDYMRYYYAKKYKLDEFVRIKE